MPSFYSRLRKLKASFCGQAISFSIQNIWNLKVDIVTAGFLIFSNYRKIRSGAHEEN